MSPPLDRLDVLRSFPRALMSCLLSLMLSGAAFGAGPGKNVHGESGTPTGVPRPYGMYVLDDVSNERAAANVYATGLTSSSAYLNDITGHAIFVPISKLLTNISTWGKFNWDWSFLDTLVQIALSHGKVFSIELETGFQTSSATYQQSLPSGFSATCGPDCAPLFDVWAVGGTGGTCISAYVLLPWIPKVQEFWDSLATALSAHLKVTGAYPSLTLVHVPGLSVYDEELRLPTGTPSPMPSDTLPCPDGRPAYPTAINDADTSIWRALGYSDSALVKGFAAVAGSFARAFPDRYLGLSLFPPGGKGIDFPNLTRDPVGFVALELVKAVDSLAPGRVQLQADVLDANMILPEVKTFASQDSDAIGWQSNKHGGTGAGCDGGFANSCDPDGPNGPYFQLLQYGAMNGGTYVEVWSADVVQYTEGFAAAKAAGFYTLTAVAPGQTPVPMTFELKQNYPNPFNPRTTIRFSMPERAHVVLRVFNLLGERVATLIDETRSPGSYSSEFDATALGSGVYFYRLSEGNNVQTRSMLVIK